MIGVGDIAVLVTVIGAGTYVLGLVAVAWPIYARITRDGVVTWHAVSLIPRTVVAGQGVRILIGYPLALTVLLLLLSTSFQFLNPLVESFLDSGITSDVIGLLVLLCLILLMFFLAGHPALQWFFAPKGRDYPVSMLLTFPAWLLGLGILFGGSWPLLERALEVEWSGLSPEITVHGNLLVLGMVLAFVGNFVLGLEGAVTIAPPLPKIEIITAEKRGAAVSGRLVAHADGFWHFFDESSTLTAIPDDKVVTVKHLGDSRT